MEEAQGNMHEKLTTQLDLKQPLADILNPLDLLWILSRLDSDSDMSSIGCTDNPIPRKSIDTILLGTLSKDSLVKGDHLSHTFSREQQL